MNKTHPLKPAKQTIPETVVTLFHHHLLPIESIAALFDINRGEVESIIRLCYVDSLVQAQINAQLEHF